MHIDEDHHDESDHVGDADVRKEQASLHVTDGKHGERVAAVAWYFLEVVHNIDGDEHSAGKCCDGREEPAAETKEAEEDGSIEAYLVNQLRLLRVEEGRDPSQERVRSAWWDLVANVVFDFGLIDNLGR